MAAPEAMLTCACATTGVNRATATNEIIGLVLMLTPLLSSPRSLIRELCFDRNATCGRSRVREALRDVRQMVACAQLTSRCVLAALRFVRTMRSRLRRYSRGLSLLALAIAA